MHPCYSFRLYAGSALARMKKKLSFKNGKLKTNRASETEEQRKERLRIGCEKDRTRRITIKLQEKKKWSSETEDHEKQRLATLKRLKRVLLERKLRLEKVVTNKPQVGRGDRRRKKSKTGE